jgi:hypothetical protein
VMVGGLSTSALFTLVLIPALFTLWFDVRAWAAERVARAWNGRVPGAHAATEGDD